MPLLHFSALPPCLQISIEPCQPPSFLEARAIENILIKLIKWILIRLLDVSMGNWGDMISNLECRKENRFEEVCKETPKRGGSRSVTSSLIEYLWSNQKENPSEKPQNKLSNHRKWRFWHILPTQRIIESSKLTNLRSPWTRKSWDQIIQTLSLPRSSLDGVFDRRASLPTQTTRKPLPRAKKSSRLRVKTSSIP